MPNSRKTPAAIPLRLRTLGGLSLVDATGLAVGQQRRRLALLALIACAGERGVTRDRVMSLLSPDSDTESARHSLHQLMYYLRQQAGDGLFLGTDPLRLNPEIIVSDVAEFEQALDRGDDAGAVASYTGPFLDGFHLDLADFQVWVEGERSRLAALYGNAMQRLARAAHAAGDHVAAVEWRRRLATLDPLSGTVALDLMRALAVAGDATGAVRHARVHEELVRAELGSGADPDVVAFAAQLSLSQHPRPRAEVRAADQLPFGAASEAPRRESHTTEESRGATAVAAAPIPRRPRLAWRPGRLVAGAIGAGVLLAGAVLFLRRTPAADAPRGLVAILPFRVSVRDSSLTWLSEGMVELLTIRLAEEGRMRLAEPGRGLQAWRRELNRTGADGSPDAISRLATAIDAERIIQGSASGSSRYIVLSASILGMPSADVIARASVEGSPDSLPALVDRLAAQLMGIAAGVERHRVAALTSASLPAIRAYLEGREAMRAGRVEDAVPRFRTAIELDSTFALAGLALARAAFKAGDNEPFDRGRNLALARQDRLGEADRALLGVTTVVWESAPQMFSRWNAAARSYPELPEMWYGLGEAYYKWGKLAGLDRYLERADDAFRRGWQLDSAASGVVALVAPGPVIAEPLRSMVELAQMRGDTARVLRLVSIGMVVDSTSDLALALRWHRLVAQGASRDEFWRSVGGGSYMAIGPIFMFTTWTGLATEDYALARSEAVRRLRLNDPGILSYVLRSTALNGGRQIDAQSALEGPWVLPRSDLRLRMDDALEWGGDSASARAAALRLAPFSDARSTEGVERRAHYRDVCVIARWQLAHGNPEMADAAIARLRSATFRGLSALDSIRSQHHAVLCAALLEAERSVTRRLPDALPSVALADSLARTWVADVCCVESVTYTNLLLARLWERQGDLPRALQAARRGGGRFMDAPHFLSSFLLQEGRLAALTGDTAGAIHAYRHYLALRANHEPSVLPEIDRARAALTALTRGR